MVRDCYDALVGLAFSSGLAMAMEIGGGWMDGAVKGKEGKAREIAV